MDQNRQILIAVAVVGISGAVLSYLWCKRSKKLIALNPKEKIPFTLIEKEIISHDTRRFRFALQSPDHVLGLPIGQHMYLSAKIDGKLAIRPYTPVTSDDEVGYFDLVVKVYFKNVNERFPEGGKMSQYLENLAICESIDVRGPSGHLTYLGHGTFQITEPKKPVRKMKCSNLGLIAGGTGITPMLQVIKAVLKVATDKTKLFLLFANQTEEDILLRDELESIARKYRNRFKVWYTVDRPPAHGWKFSSGFITEDMIDDHLPKASDDSVMLMCGPPPMINYACLPNLKKLGFSDDQMFAF